MLLITESSVWRYNWKKFVVWYLCEEMRIRFPRPPGILKLALLFFDDDITIQEWDTIDP